jgi:hypothetical protein
MGRPFLMRSSEERRVKPSIRIDHLSFNHHRLVAYCEPPEQKMWEKGAAINGHFTGVDCPPSYRRRQEYAGEHLTPAATSRIMAVP